ncbi:MAG: redox-regulated ATPase YchF [Spirochaetia bacterium]
MALNCGIVGMPNVGKSTIFSALTARQVPAENYPFCTIKENIGVTEVPDPRLRKIFQIMKPLQEVPASMRFVDVAGLVKGASRGDGMGNRFLGAVRETGIIAHVVRCFSGGEVPYAEGSRGGVPDIEVVDTELALADLETVQGRLDKEGRRGLDPELPALYDRISDGLNHGTPARNLARNGEEREALADLNLLSMKEQLYVCNIDERNITGDSECVSSVQKYAETFRQRDTADRVIVLSGKIEAEIALLDDPEERAVFLKDAGLEESGLNRLIRAAYRLLGLRTFFTVNEKEAHAWTIPAGSSALEAAGKVHTDFQRGFVKAEVYHCEDLFRHGSEKEVRDAGKYRTEGRDYEVEDGDIIFFKANPS